MSLELALKFTLQFEGGYVNDPDDPGGKTNYGITEATFNLAKKEGLVKSRSVEELTKEEAEKIYEEMYFKPLRCHEMPSWVAVMVFDTAVNQGLAVAGRLLQKALRDVGFNVVVDGQVGNKTIETVKKLEGSGREEQFIVWFSTYRALRYLEVITKNHKLVKFAKGWYRRTFAMQEYALSLLREKNG